jgi:hypothetical protein
MEWVQFIVFFITVFGLWLWQRAESRADIRHMDAQLKANRDLIHEMHKENIGLMKDFHYRLIEIEKARKT